MGTAGGSVSNDRFSNIVLRSGTNGTEYNFGDVPVTQPIGPRPSKRNFFAGQ